MEPVKLHHLIPVLNPDLRQNPSLSPAQQDILKFIDGYTSLAALPTMVGRSLDEITSLIRELIALGMVQLYQRPPVTRDKSSQTVAYGNHEKEAYRSARPTEKNPQPPGSFSDSFAHVRQSQSVRTQAAQSPPARMNAPSSQGFSRAMQAPPQVARYSEANLPFATPGPKQHRSMTSGPPNRPHPQTPKPAWGGHPPQRARAPMGLPQTPPQSWGTGSDSTMRFPRLPEQQAPRAPQPTAPPQSPGTPGPQQYKHEWGNGSDSTMRFPRPGPTPSTNEWHPSQARQGNLQSRIERDMNGPSGTNDWHQGQQPNLQSRIAQDMQNPSGLPPSGHGSHSMAQIADDRTQVVSSSFDEKTMVAEENHALLGPDGIYQNIGNPDDSKQMSHRYMGDEDTMREQGPPKISKIQQRYRERLSQAYSDMRQQGSQQALPASPIPKKS